jgi:hypothetical protein
MYKVLILYFDARIHERQYTKLSFFQTSYLPNLYILDIGICDYIDVI